MTVEDYKPTGTVTRYVITHVRDRGALAGVRCLTFGAQGRWTYATADEAQETLRVFLGPGGLPRVLSTAELATVRVEPCPCWPEHFDPCRTVGFP